jgi:hypothetical protein
MFAGSEQGIMLRVKLRPTIACIILVSMCFPRLLTADEQPLSGPNYSGSQSTSSGPIAYVVDRIKEVKPGEDVGEVIEERRVADHLKYLAETVGYQGDISVLKETSTALKKRDRLLYRHAITLLDDAIASQADELRQAMSITNFAAKFKPGRNIYADFVRHKLAFLESEKGRFYERGPFEIAVVGLLANSIEALALLEDTDPQQAVALTKREIALVDKIFSRISTPNRFDASPTERQVSINGNRFWRASLAFLIGNREEAAEALRKIVEDNKEFGPKFDDSSPLYIYKIFDLLYSITVGQGIDRNEKPEYK